MLICDQIQVLVKSSRIPNQSSIFFPYLCITRNRDKKKSFISSIQPGWEKKRKRLSLLPCMCVCGEERDFKKPKMNSKLGVIY